MGDPLHIKIRNQFQISKMEVPIMQLFYRGMDLGRYRHEYPGMNRAAPMLDFLNTKTSHIPKKLGNADEAESFYSDNSEGAVLYLNKPLKASKYFAPYLGAGLKLCEERFVAMRFTDDAEAAKAAGISAPALIYFHGN